MAHYTGQAELAECIQEGLDARKAGDNATATFKLGRAVQLAAQSGNDGTMKLLAAVVDVEDPATGTVRLRNQITDVDEMALDTRSTRTVRVGPEHDCHLPQRPLLRDLDYCDQCGAPIGAVATPLQPTVELPILEDADTSPSEVRDPCPVCRAPRSGDDRYCEGCGHDFLAPRRPR